MRFLLVLLLLPCSLFALYNGNPSAPMMPEQGMFISKDYWLGIKTGYLFDDVYDRKLHMSGQGSTSNHVRKKVREYEAISNYGVVTLNVMDRFELFFPLGAMRSELNQYPYPGTKVSYRTQNHFAWGAGARAILAYWRDIQLGLNASYIQSNAPLSSLEVNDKSYPKHGAEYKFREWQVGAGISYRLNWFIPYIGADYSDFRTHITHLNTLKSIFPKKHVTIKERYPLGMFLGFGLSANKAFAMNFEARVFNENAFSLSADFKF